MITSPADEWITDLDDLAAGNAVLTTAMLDMPDLDARWLALDAIRLPQTGN